MNHKILLIEDEAKLCRILELVLTDHGYQVKTAREGQQGIDIWCRWHPDVVVTDLKMHPVDGTQVLNFGRLNFPDVPLIMLTAFGSISTAVAAMKNGAFDFLTKPVDHHQLLEVIEQALAMMRKEPMSLEALIGSSAEMERIRKNIRLFASTDSSVLIIGESGTGKEIAANALHEMSSRNNEPFVKVNCAAIPRELIESELFGHRKGAFTGALSDRVGAFIQADKGVLFLDEIGDLPLDLQPKLLHAVENKTITPIGSNTATPVSVKILSATNRDLDAMVKASEFRADLFYRLNTVCLNMPALRDIPTSIRELSLHFLTRYCREFNKPLIEISDEAMREFKAYMWPGNVRELKNIMERLALTCEEPILRPNHLPECIHRDRLQAPLNDSKPTSLDMVSQEQYLLATALKTCDWNQSNAARMLGITRSALRYRLQKYGLKK